MTVTQQRTLSDSLCACFRKWRNKTVIIQVLCFGSIRKSPHAYFVPRIRGVKKALPEYLGIAPMVVDNNLDKQVRIFEMELKVHTSQPLATPRLPPLGYATNDSPRATTLAPPRRTIIAKISKHHHLQSDLVLAHIISPPSLILSSAFQHQDHRQNETHPSCRARTCSYPDQVRFACCLRRGGEAEA